MRNILTFAYLLVCPLTSANIIFSEAHDMSWFRTRIFKFQQIFVMQYSLGESEQRQTCLA